MSVFESCILGFRECSDKNPCVIHHKWAEERQRIYDIFNISVEAVVKDIKSGKLENLKL